MNVHFERATLLLKQHRREQAIAELHQALSEDPNLAPAHALLALCLSNDGQHDEATREAEAAIGLSPEMAFAHYALAVALVRRNRFAEAEAAIAAAIELDPSDADYFALSASIQFEHKNWAAALDAADRGLAQDAENAACANLRASALMKLGRSAEAGATIEGVLARDPEDAGSHATLGWTLLQQSRPREALESFREALRIDPHSEPARAGMVEALKARYRIYGLMLRYFMWMSRLSGRAQWMVILGGFFGMRLLRQAAVANPEIGKWVWPIGFVYAGFVLLTWLADPLFNLVLRLNRFGRLALSREQVVSSNWVGGCLGLAIVMLGMAVVLDSGVAALLAIVTGLSVLPLSAVFNCHRGWPRNAMAAYTAAVALVGCVAAFSLPADLELTKSTMGIFGVGIFAATFVANGLATVRPKL